MNDPTPTSASSERGADLRLARRLRMLAKPPHEEDDPRLMALALSALFFAGATLGAVSILLPHPSEFRDAALWSNIALGYVGAVLGYVFRNRLTPWGVQLVMLLANVLITRAVILSHEPTGFYTFFYVWLAVYAFFFYGRLWGGLHTAFSGLLFAIALTTIPTSSPLARWMMLMVTLMVVGVFIDALAQRIRRIAHESALRANNLEAIGEVAHQIARHHNAEDAAGAIIDAAVEVAEAGMAFLAKPSPDGRGLLISSSTLSDALGTVIPFAGPPSGAVRAFTSGEPYFVADTRTSKSVDKRMVEMTRAATALFQPVVHDDTPIGVLVVVWREPRAALGSEVCSAVELLATEASIAIQRAELVTRLEHAARTDDLTGLPNRRSWNLDLEIEVERARRNAAPLAIAVLDLDRFKLYNDQHGHLAGDRFLKEVAAAWRQSIRPTDVLARYGGEEFALALPDCGREEAVELVERLRVAIPERQTVSAGIAMLEPGESTERLMARADAALYAAKDAGRDQVMSG